ncbi:MAG: Uma2 family endonuclease [Caldilineales bacterium]|nr:Uma2 family endonuclease [Caldilineales bacterium]
MAVQVLPRQKPKPLQKARISGDELYRMPGIDHAELVQGEIVPMSPTGYLHGLIKIRMAAWLEAAARQGDQGIVLGGEVGVYTRRNPDTVRAMEAAFISHARMAQVQSRSYLDVAPELVVEVLSPGDSWQAVMSKLEEYFEIGVSTVWIVDPDRQVIYVYQGVMQTRRLGVGDVLTAAGVLEGVEIEVAALFAPV